MGDPKLAALMRKLNPPAPLEAIQHVEWVVTAFERSLGTLREGWIIVRLACGHTTRVRLLAKRVRCRECHRIILDGEDYDAFRHGGT